MFFPTFSLEYVSHDLGLTLPLLTLLHEILTQGCHNFAAMESRRDKILLSRNMEKRMLGI